jgi:putative flippase GtrA
MRAEAARRVLPSVVDQGWFFDTELLVLAQRAGMRIHEVPVDWVDDADSRVDIVSTAMGDLRGVARLFAASHVVRFMGIGLISTFAYALLYLGMRPPLGQGAANAAALGMTAVANTHANRHFTFGLRGREGLLRQHAAGAIVFAVTLALTSAALAVLQHFDPHPARPVELTVLVLAGVGATVTRYIGLRTWVFAKSRNRRQSAQEALNHV